ncbi:hypothetical protein V497_03904 [Pseudogymnoascus sp. VKM F-4516 (FW-969)]|nr:hypothetical protein V497_03904 [Pseudogymnoascus sp. VKM F-4516 (FW-969)]
MSFVESSKPAQAALLHWVNTFPLDRKARSLVDLSDGKLLYQVMADIDPGFTRRRSDEKNTFQAVIRGLRYFIVTECGDCEELVESPGFIAISADGETGDILELTSFLLVAAINGPRREEYITTIMTFDEAVQSEIKVIIEQRMKEAHDAKESGDKIYHAPPNHAGQDEFQLEYRYGVLLGQNRELEQEKDQLTKQNADLTTRLTHLQENNDSLQDHLRDAEDRLNAPIRDDETLHRIRTLEDKVRERDEVIETLEGQREQDREKMARMTRDLSNLKDADSRLIQVQDEVKELEFKNEDLTKKANTVDHYKKKLELQKDLQKNFKDLELENEEMKAQFQNFEKLAERNSSLEASQRQFQNSISKAEMEIFEIGSQKKMLEAENAEMVYQLATQEEKCAQYEQKIFELQEQSPLPEISPHGQNLAEMMQNSDADRQANVENYKLKAENALLKGNTLAAKENSSLRAQLDEADAHAKVIEGKYREAFEKDVISQQQLRAMMNLVDDNKKDQAFVELKRSHDSLTEEMAALQKKLTALEAEHEDAKRELLMATSDLSMVDKEEIDALEELKATQESLSQSFENELTALKGKYKALLIDYEAQKSQLIESLLANNKLREALEKSTDIEPPAADDETKEAALAPPAQPNVSTPFSPPFSMNWRIFNTRYFVGSFPKRDRSATLPAQKLAQTSRVGNHYSSGIPHRTRNPLIINPAAIPLPESQPNTARNIPLPDSCPSTARSEPFNAGERHAEELLKKDATIAGLQAQVKELEENGNDAQKVALERENDNLKREYGMMTMAWYDLSSRVQSNTVMLQRRSEVSKSWINKQRRAVNPTGRR